MILCVSGVNQAVNFIENPGGFQDLVVQPGCIGAHQYLLTVDDLTLSVEGSVNDGLVWSRCHGISEESRVSGPRCPRQDVANFGLGAAAVP